MAEIKSKSVEISDMNRELQKVIKSGKVLIGSNETLKALRGEGVVVKAVIYASNCPEEIKERFKEITKQKKGNIPFYEYPVNSIELGLACGKPYSIASLCLLDTGKSDILRLIEKEKKRGDGK
ncbi:50S ribosomal protein L30e [ANME-1 cluster archaeon GoMg1]|nr:50S ribosomal protein L30e [ANME-1 cluster archaeon GoMg1]